MITRRMKKQREEEEEEEKKGERERERELKRTAATLATPRSSARRRRTRTRTSGMNGRKSTEGEHDVHVNVPCSSYDYNHADHADDETRRVKREQSFSKQGLGKLSSVGRPKFSLAYARQLLDTNYYAGVALCAAGIIGTLVCYGILQERIMTIPYGEKGRGNYFKYSLFIVLLNRFLTCCTAFVTCVVKGEGLKPVAPLYAYAGVSISNVVATSCQYEALKYVTFPVQTLAKTAKMVPVMLWGTVILLKSYSWKEYVMALAVTGGCSLFLLSGDASSKVSKVVSSDSGLGGSAYGGLLMLGYLGFDGFTSTFQEKLFKGFEMSSHHQVLYITMFSTTFAFISLVLSNTLFPAITFVFAYPRCIIDILLLSSTAVTSQFIIAGTIKHYGALVFATIMTTRQFVSILVSSILFAHPLVGGQWLGLLVVFGTLYMKIAQRKKPAKPSSQLPSSSSSK